PALLVATNGLLDRLAVEAVMAAELSVLACDHRRNHVAVDPAERGRVLGDPVLVHQHRRGDRHVPESIDDHQLEADADEPDDGEDEETEYAEHWPELTAAACTRNLRRAFPSGSDAPKREVKDGSLHAVFRMSSMGCRPRWSKEGIRLDPSARQ